MYNYSFSEGNISPAYFIGLLLYLLPPRVGGYSMYLLPFSVAVSPPAWISVWWSTGELGVSRWGDYLPQLGVLAADGRVIRLCCLLSSPVVRMGLRCSWVLVAALVCGAGLASAGGGGLVRRQAGSWWQNYRPSEWDYLDRPRVRPTPVRLPWPVWPPRHVDLPGRGRFDGGASQSRQLPTAYPAPRDPSVSVQCEEDRMVVTVRRDFYGNGNLVKAAELSLGPCRPGAQSADPAVLVFENKVQECDSELQVTSNWLIYSNQLLYTPAPGNSIVIRSNPAVVPIRCYYPRYGNVSSEAIKPTWVPFSTTLSTDERLLFSLRLMSDDWSAPRSSSVFQLGDTFSIEASVDTLNHAPMILFVDFCVATLSSNMNSSPRYEIISANGCLVDGLQEDSSSAFRSPRPRPDKLQFSVDAFRFVETDVSMIYITCYLRAASVTQAPDAMNKACSYNKASGRWLAVDGPSDICQCCNSGNCAAPASQSRIRGDLYGRPRMGKRDVGIHTEEHGLATLGPLLVVGGEPNPALGVVSGQASRMVAESGPLELWMIVAVALTSLVVGVVALVVIGNFVIKRFSNRDAFQ